MSCIQNSDIGEIVRKAERDYIYGNTTTSKYVNFSMYDTISKIEAYLNSKHTSGLTDSLGRKKPFFNIVVSASNIWYRATDIDRKNIKVKATKNSDVIASFLATVHLQEWMRKNNFGAFLNEWGRVLARYGSAVLKFVDNSEGLTPMVIPWNRLIVDPVDFDSNVKIEVLELTEAQLRKKKGYNQQMVNDLCNSLKTRETIDKQRKDNKADYIKLYEVHGELPLSVLKMSRGEEVLDGDDEKYLHQIHVLSFSGVKGKRGTYNDYVLYCGEENDPYMITHLIKEDGRTLAIGAVEHLFDAQWMQNHTAKQIKDQLDLASKIIFQTSDSNFVGQNALSAIENGDVLIHTVNQPISAINNRADISGHQAFSSQWKQLGNEINGISEAMMGEVKSGAAWRQTEAILNESHSLFELMVENKKLDIEKMLTRFILNRIKKDMDTTDEVVATLDGYDLQKIDRAFIKNSAIKNVNKKIKNALFNKKAVFKEEQDMQIMGAETEAKDYLNGLGNNRFFKPSDVPSKTWKQLFKNLEWDLEIEVEGENRDVQGALATLNTALSVMMNPAYEQNKKAQLVVNKILEMAGTLSPLEISALDSVPAGMPTEPMARSAVGIKPTLPTNTQQ